MSTYTLYYQAPLVHAQPSQLGAPNSQHPVLKLHAAQPHLPPPATALHAAGPSIDGKRVPLSSRRKLSRATRAGFWTYAQLQSPFFRLPAELRNQIYEYLLDPEPVQICDKHLDLSVRGFNQTTTPLELHPGILATCRKAYDEAEALLYARHTFHAHPNLLDKLPHLTSAARPVLYASVTSTIRRWQISLRLDTDPTFSYADAKNAFSGAEYLEVRVWQSQFMAVGWGVLRLFTGVRGVGVARVGGSVGKELARWLENVMMQPLEEEKKRVCECSDGGEVICGRCKGVVEKGLWFGGR